MVICHTDVKHDTLNLAFNALIDSFIHTQVGVVEGFLDSKLAACLRANLEALHAGERLKSAGIGNLADFAENKLIRLDKIHWLDRAHADEHEHLFLEQMDAFVVFLNQECYAGIRGYEFHYAFYEAGSFYKRHLDQFRTDDSRVFSMIMYLNVAWVEADGGELCIYHDGHTQRVSPVGGKCVFFRSDELSHEVLVTHSPRLSITGWLKR